MRLWPALVLMTFVGCAPAQEPPAAPAPGRVESSPQQPAQPAQPSGLLVLLPEEMARQESSAIPELTVEQGYYAVSRRDGELSWSLTGSVVNRAESTVDATPRKPAATVRGVSVYVSENEGIKSATWIENGTAFALDVECASDQDARCTSNAYLLERVQRLVEKQP